IGCWYLEDGTVACDSSAGTASFTGNHVNNDLFIVSSFTNGGSNSDIIVYRWVGGAAGHLDTAGEITGAPADCSSSNASNVACATVNSSALTSPHPPWQTHASGSQTLDTNEFFEGML